MEMIRIIHIVPEDALWQKTIVFAEGCSWSAGKHLGQLMRACSFSGWEAVFIAAENDDILGFCTFLKEDHYPENRYSPWISSIFVDEAARGKRISHQLIEAAVLHAKESGFSKVYIPSDMKGFYEKCGFLPIDALTNYAGGLDTVFMREV
ncbi:MAG: GNAT family N-acetyltransferase [Christensenellales bacterium]|jgi:GNAT superfamily N-acetyltransferase